MKISHEQLFRLHLIDPEEILVPDYRGCIIFLENPADNAGMVTLRAARHDGRKTVPLPPEQEEAVLRQLMDTASRARESHRDGGEPL